MTIHEQIKKKEEELRIMKQYHQDAFMMYGSELCPAHMFARERALEREIMILRDGNELRESNDAL